MCDSALRPPGDGLPLEALWREVLGRGLSGIRVRRGATLAEVAARAGIAPQYLSEAERGRKDASSEIVAARSSVAQR